MILYRRVGPKELALIAESGFAAFPPRLPEQPIFYPVLNFAYAEQIARDWNSKNAAADYQGHVLTFEVDDDYASKFPVQRAGAAIYQELWVPAEELDEFDRHIVGKVAVAAS